MLSVAGERGLDPWRFDSAADNWDAPYNANMCAVTQRADKVMCYLMRV